MRRRVSFSMVIVQIGRHYRLQTFENIGFHIRVGIFIYGNRGCRMRHVYKTNTVKDPAFLHENRDILGNIDDLVFSG